MINIDTTVDNGVATLKLRGEVDASSSINLDNAIKDAKTEGHKKILIDAQELHYISSAGLGVFMSYIKDFEKEQVKLVLFGLNEKVMNVFKMLGLDQLLLIESNVDDALRSVNS